MGADDIPRFHGLVTIVMGVRLLEELLAHALELCEGRHAIPILFPLIALAHGGPDAEQVFVSEETRPANKLLRKFYGERRNIESAETINATRAVGTHLSSTQSTQCRTAEGAIHILEPRADSEELSHVGNEGIIPLTGEDLDVVLSKGPVCASLRRERLAHNRVLDSLLRGTSRTVDLDQLARFALAYWNAAELRLDDQIIARVVITRELELIEELVRKTIGR